MYAPDEIIVKGLLCILVVGFGTSPTYQTTATDINHLPLGEPSFVCIRAHLLLIHFPWPKRIRKIIYTSNT